jgi:hypothetical protein
MSKGGKDDKCIGVPQVACIVAASLMFLSGVLSAGALALPWWQGKPGGEIVNEEPQDKTLTSSVSLWSYDLTVRVAPEPGETEEVTRVMTDVGWGDACTVTEERRTQDAPVAEAPPPAPTSIRSHCMKIELIRAMGFIAIILGQIATTAFVVAFLFSPLLALIGALFGTGATLSTMAQGILTAMINTGAYGLGAQFAGGSLLCALTGALIGLYGAAKAVAQENEDNEEVPEGTRQERAAAARDAAAENQFALERAANSRRKRPHTAGSDDSDQEPQKAVPVYLHKVLFWNTERTEADEEEIPTDLLELAFREMDEDGSGCVEMEELVEGLASCNIVVSQAATEMIMKEIDKNASGDIDVTEFVEFFRHIEELNKFSKRTAQRAQVASFMLNCCFLVDIVAVGFLLMVFLRMESTGGDDYVILKNILMALSMKLFLLFNCVVAMPAARLTLGPSIDAWQKHYGARMIKPKKAMVEDEEQGPREASWTPGPVEHAPVQANLMSKSYRNVFKVQDMVNTDPYQQSAPLPRSRGGGQSRQPSMGNQQDMTMAPQSIGDNTGQLVITNEMGEFERYNPDTYLQSELNMLQVRPMNSFSPIQVLGNGHGEEQPLEVRGDNVSVRKHHTNAYAVVSLRLPRVRQRILEENVEVPIPILRGPCQGAQVRVMIKPQFNRNTKADVPTDLFLAWGRRVEETTPLGERDIFDFFNELHQDILKDWGFGGTALPGSPGQGEQTQEMWGHTYEAPN